MGTQPTFMQRGPFRIGGYRLTTTMDRAGADIPPFWSSLVESSRMSWLGSRRLDGAEPPGVLGVAVGDDDERLDYYAAIVLPRPQASGWARAELPSELETYDVPAATWAVFAADGELPRAIAEMINWIWYAWLPSSGFRAAEAPMIESYLEAPRQSVWLAVEPLAAA